MSNLLVTSCSAKVPLLKALKQALSRFSKDALLYGGDSSNQCVGRYFTDRFWQMPHLNTLSVEALTAYCQAESIRFIIPTRDGELGYFAHHKEALAQQDITVMVAAPSVIESCLDKFKFAQMLEQYGFPGIPTELSLDALPGERFVVKERYGAGSHNMGINLTQPEAQEVAQRLKNPVFQPYIQGKEYSIDFYATQQHQAHGIIVRERTLVRHGESQISTTLPHPPMEQLTGALCQALQLYGHNILQIFEANNGALHIIECNNRFGGASTLSIATGLHSPDWFLQEATQQSLSAFQRSAQEKTLVRFAEDLILEGANT